MLNCSQDFPVQSRASFGFVSVRPFSSLSLSSRKSITLSNSRSLSVFALGCALQPHKITITSVILSAMSKACVARFHGFHHKTSTQLSRRCGAGFSRSSSACSGSLISTSCPLIVRSPTSLVVSASLTESDAPQRSEEWFALRKDKLTTSTFSTVLGFWKGKRRLELWQEKVFLTEAQVFQASARFAMQWGVLNEAAAIDRYKSITGREVSSLGFAVHSEERLEWLGASPDGLLGCFPGGGILEVKCPYNKGKPELGLPWSIMPFYYMPQVQGQLEIMDREWADLYCWTPNGSTIFRVCRDRSYWELIHEILREFWWENVIPAREALALGLEEKARTYEPELTHKQTGIIISKSIKLAADCKMLCREIAGHVEFYR
ncbi:hypothetical protein Tsubulata_046519 [Turnera subulata]|uniref:YqaJ viral recombinase domain-containing protein n=1 Tax=Turnera subulata TaxID=218843 RepID=A0A9Q0GJ67_9ROSI|nr:hypothetical protein Tsubulata_046519 [Turnera subulata]